MGVRSETLTRTRSYIVMCRYDNHCTGAPLLKANKANNFESLEACTRVCVCVSDRKLEWLINHHIVLVSACVNENILSKYELQYTDQD